MQLPSNDFVNTAEQINIWMFLGCVIIAVGCMMPEAIMGPSEFNNWLSLQASLSLVAICLLWLVTQTLWFLIRRIMKTRNDNVSIAA